MNLQRIEDTASGASWALHPRISVVVSDAPDFLHELGDALAGDYAAAHPRFVVWVADDTGVEWQLTPEALRQMGLTTTIPNMVRQADIPGVLFRSLYDVFPDPEAEWYRAQNQRQAALGELAACASERAAWEEARESAATSPKAEGAIAANEAAALDAEAKWQALDAEVREAEAFRDEVRRQESGTDQIEASRYRLERLQQSIQERIEEITNLLQVDREGLATVRALIAEAAAEADLPSRDDEIERIDSLGVKYQELAQWRQRLNALPRPPQWVIAQTQGEYEEARGRFQALEYQAKQGIDCESELHRARIRFEEAEAAWNALLAGTEDQEEALQRESADLCTEASDYLGVAVGIEEVGAALHERRQEVANRRDPRFLLGQMLSARSLVVTPENVIDVAESWLEGAPEDSRSDEELQLDLAVAVSDLADVKDQLLALVESVEQDPQFSIALQEAEAALEDLRTRREEAHRERLAFSMASDSDYTEQLPLQLAAREAEARHIANDAELRLMLLSQHAHTQEAVIADLENVSPQELQNLLLARLATMRGLLGPGASVALPLILDRLTESLSGELTDLVVTTMVKVSGLVPVICLVTPSGARRWADHALPGTVGFVDITHANVYGPDQARR